MHIQLLPPILPPQRSLSPEAPRVALTPGQRVTAMVLTPDLEGRSMLAFAGRELASRSPLPFPPGSTILLEVVSVDGDVPALRVVPEEATAEQPVAVGTYGYAAAVLAARGGGDVLAAAQTLIRWLPMLVARGLLTPRQAQQLTGDLGRSLVAESAPPPAGGGLATAMPSAQALADALAARVNAEGAGLEARIAAALRQAGGPTADQLAANGMRGRLAALRALLSGAEASAQPEESAELAAARSALKDVEDALLADQARVAAHFARDGVLTLRLPMTVGTQDVDVHLRVSEEAEDGDGPESAEAASAHRVQLDIDLETLGRVQVQLITTSEDVRVELITERPSAADAIEEGVASLTSALIGAGFRDVLTRVSIDPIRVTAGDLDLELPPEGSILNADA